MAKRKASNTAKKAVKSVKRAGSKAAAMASRATRSAKSAASRQVPAVRRKVGKVSRAASREASKAKESILQKVPVLGKPSRNGSFKCQICGKVSRDSIDATTHMIDHGASALGSVSSMIKDQKEGRVSKEDRDRATSRQSAK